MDKTTYRVIDRTGNIEADGLSLADAATTILTYDGGRYEIRPDADGRGFVLWHKEGGMPRFEETIFFSLAETEEEAEADIFAQVCGSSECFKAEAKPENTEADKIARQHAPELAEALEDAEFLLRMLAEHPGDVMAMRDSLKRSSDDARDLLARIRGEG